MFRNLCSRHSWGGGGGENGKIKRSRMAFNFFFIFSSVPPPNITMPAAEARCLQCGHITLL